MIGEPDRIRTCDPLIKSQLLYQLSYGPYRNRGEHRPKPLPGQWVIDGQIKLLGLYTNPA